MKKMIGFVVLCMVSHAMAGTVFVAQQGAHVFPYGSWENAATSIQCAVDAALSGDTVLISNGTFVVSQEILVTNLITIRGVHGAAATTVSGDHQTRCFHLKSSGARLDGLTIANGKAYIGGGAACSNGSFVMNCVFRNCSSTHDAGGLYMRFTMVSNCQFIGNTSMWGGGVLVQDYGRIENCYFSGNHATKGGGGLYGWGPARVYNCLAESNTAGWGGGFMLDETSVGSNCVARFNTVVESAGGIYLYNEGRVYNSEVYNNYAQWGGGMRLAETGQAFSCVIRDNDAKYRGGGVYLDDKTSLSDSQVFGNYGDYGGGVQVDDNAGVYDCVISNNSARFGGGIQQLGGAIHKCKIINNNAIHSGGGLYEVSSSVRFINAAIYDSVISGNVASNGGGAYLDRYSGPMQNCLLVDNHAFNKGGGLHLNISSNIQSVTCAGNRADNTGGGIFVYNGMPEKSVKNAVISGNHSAGVNDIYVGSLDLSATFYHCCLPQALGCPGQVTNAPLFVDAANGNYQLQKGSPCIEAGYVDDYPATDLLGLGRPVDANADGVAYPDMGAYEYPGDTLAVSFYAEIIEGTPPFNAVFHTYLSGTNLTGLYFRWDFDADGSIDLEGTGLTVVTNAYPEGVYSIQLHLSNGVGEVYTATRTNYIESSQPETFFMAHGGGHVAPFTNWVMAATNIEAVLGYMRDDETVVVSNGTYALQQPVRLTNAVIITSANGAEQTIFDGGGTTRCFQIAHTGAVLDHLTITRGAALRGAGVYSEQGGTIQYCNIISNKAWDYDGRQIHGGGVYLNDGGLVSHCWLEGNWAYDGHYYEDGEGSAVYIRTNGVVRNCLAIRNLTDGRATLHGGYIENCTIVENTGRPIAYAHVQNCIYHYNTDNYCYICVVSNSISGSNPDIPKFIDPDNDNYRLRPDSAYVDSGNTSAWMSSAVDLAGNPRIMGQGVDYGAYETDMNNLGCWIVMEKRIGPVPVQVVLSSYIYGTNTADVYYQWDVDGDGNIDVAGYNLQTVTSSLVAAGTYFPTLYISNAAGESATYGSSSISYEAYARLTNYVSKTGSSLAPYTNWATAANSIYSALRVAHEYGQSGVVCVATGTYRESFTIQNGVTLKSQSGAGKTILDDKNYGGGLALYNDATLDGFTITHYRSGITVNNGKVLNCRVVDNVNSYGSGGGIEIVGPALIENCLIADNECRYTESGGGICSWYTNAIIRNCVIKGNRVVAGTGGGVYGGKLINCTVIKNNARWGGGIAHAQALNSIIVSNCNDMGGDNYYDADIDYSCTTPMPHGTGNIDDDPVFAFPSRWTLAENSPCVDAGSNMSWMLTATDFDGFNRLYNGVVDMGAYEYGYPRGGLYFNPQNGPSPLVVDFTSLVQGLGAGVLWYAWDFEQDGVIDYQTNQVSSATHSYDESGEYRPLLIVSNTFGEQLEITSDEPIYAAADVMYVSSHGSHQFPYTNWSMAATNLSTAVTYSANKMTIWVTNGSYTVKNIPILDNGVLIRSVNGASKTILNSWSGRCFYMNHSNAVVDGFSIRYGYAQTAGGCIYIEQGGTVRNCHIYSGHSSTYGGNIYMLNGGLVTNCIIEKGRSMYGAGVFIKNAGEVRNCLIISNTATRYGAGVAFDYGGLVVDSVIRGNTAGSRSTYYPSHESRGGGANFNEGGLLRNCLVTGNYAVDGSGVFNYEGHVESCTIADNTSLHAGGAAVMSEGSFKNSIMHADEEDKDVAIWVPGAFDYCCADMVLNGTGNVKANPAFIDPSSDDFNVRAGSPCIDGGVNEAWMNSAQDVQGRNRILDHRVDIGALEYIESGGYCNFSVYHEGVETWDAEFVPYVSDMMADPVYCAWDFNDDGIMDLQVGGLQPVTHTYTDYGTYSVVLVVSNQIGERAEYRQDAVVSIAPLALYVASAGQQVYPYSSWETAATNLQTALNLAGNGSTVFVSNGIYRAAVPFVIAHGACLRSINGPQKTIIDGNNNHQCLSMNHVDAVVDGFSFFNGYTYTNGGGVYCAGVGTITNCAIYNNVAEYRGGGVYMYHRARMQNSHVYSNRADYGGGIFCYDDALIEACRINDNHADKEGGGVYLESAKIQNSLIVNNAATKSGGGIEMTGDISSNKTIVGHCTIIGNRALKGSGVDLYLGRVINSIVYDNPGLNFSWRYDSWRLNGSVESCLMNNYVEGETVITNDPLFVDAASGDYRIQAASPCVDAGILYPWIADDMNGVPRALDGNGDGVAGYDIGAYEVYIPGADSDRDGLNDADEIEVYGINPLQADTDGDGQFDRAELISRTDPRDDNDYFAVRRFKKQSDNGHVVLKWMSSSDCLYIVYTTSSLAEEWQVVPGWAKIPGTDDVMTFTAPATDKKGAFYRVMTYPIPGRSTF